jgi:PAS domain S-box-containing protein
MQTLKRVLESVSKRFEIPFTVADLTAPDEPLVYVNSAFEKLTGYKASEIIGRNCRFLQVSDTDPNSRKALRDAINQRKSFWMDLLNSKRDGTRFWNRLVLIPFGYDDENLKVYIGIQIAVTEDLAIIDTKFSEDRVQEVETKVTLPFKNIVDIRRSLKYLQFCEDEDKYERKMEELTVSMAKEIESIIDFLRTTAHQEFRPVNEETSEDNQSA